MKRILLLWECRFLFLPRYILRFMGFSKRLFIGFNDDQIGLHLLPMRDDGCGNVVWSPRSQSYPKREQSQIIKYYCKYNGYLLYYPTIVRQSLQIIILNILLIMMAYGRRKSRSFISNHTEFDIIGYQLIVEICKQLVSERFGADICHKVKESLQ